MLLVRVLQAFTAIRTLYTKSTQPFSMLSVGRSAAARQLCLELSLPLQLKCKSPQTKERPLAHLQ